MSATPRRARFVTALAVAIASLCASSPTRADRAPVAVVDLVDSDGSRQLAHALGEDINASRGLAPLADPTIAAALIGPFSGAEEDTAAVGVAQRALVAATDALAGFEFAAAERTAREGEAALLDVAPTTAAPLYAELALALGQARLGQRDPVGAASAFALTHRLAPDRPPLDPARYLPEVVHAFVAATGPATAAGTIDVAGSGDVWLDGARLGSAPGAFAAAAGAHVIQLAGATRFTRGAMIEVHSAQHVAVALPAAEATLAEQVARARVALSTAADAIATVAAIERLAALTGARKLVLVSAPPGGDGALQWQTWQRDDPPGLSARVAVGDRAPRELLASLAGPSGDGDVDVARPPLTALADVEPPAWYRRRWVQVSVVASVVAVVVGAVLYAREDRNRPLQGGPLLPPVTPVMP